MVFSFNDLMKSLVNSLKIKNLGKALNFKD